MFWNFIKVFLKNEYYAVYDKVKAKYLIFIGFHHLILRNWTFSRLENGN